MLRLLADRFVCDRGWWFDLATARPVRIRLRSAGTRRQQFDWSDRCATLSGLRHPLLNPLVDYGYAASSATFEAYGLLPPMRAGTLGASHTATHAVRFLRAHAIALTRESADLVVRSLRPGGRTGRPFGVVLQPRRALDSLKELLDAGGNGPVTIAVWGPPRSGMTTLRLAFARLARMAGYVPVGIEAARRWPQIQQLTSGRHLCVMSEGQAGEDSTAWACWLSRLGIESSRRHLHVTFQQRSDRVARALRLDPLGVAAMTSMIYVDPDFGPSARDIFAATRAADGWPGQFLTALRAEPLDAVELGSASTVHESPVPYDISQSHEVEPATARRPRRLASVLARAGRRAESLASAGRHTAAVRLLERAIRVLQGRDEGEQAAKCALALTWIWRSRGQVQAACAQAERVRTMTTDAGLHASASSAIGILWTDDGRYAEAESALRAAAVAAAAVKRFDVKSRAELGLARTLFWRQQHGEALAIATAVCDSALPDVSCEARALTARVRIAAGDVSGALQPASQALEIARAIHSPRLVASAYRAMALALRLAGDRIGAADHAEAGIQAATAAHLPLIALKLRTLYLTCLPPDSEPACRLRTGLHKSAFGRLPQTVREQIDAALGHSDKPLRPPQSDSAIGRAGGVIAELVEAAQRAADDQSALVRVLDVLCDRIQATSAIVIAGIDGSRLLATTGRPWRERSLMARRALESGLAVPVDSTAQPPEVAEPVKYAGEAVAAIACRWPAGSSVDSAAVALYLGGAALAISTPAQMLLEDRPIPAVGPVDLLGDSAPAVSLRDAVQRAARAPFPVLIEGESGSGKELVARAIHRLSTRRERRFCAINCAAITDELVEAELFGHARGAFTGAAVERPGLFEESDGGTLFLDEVGELSARAQAKLLRVLQDGEVRRVGENFPRRVDVRVIAATNRRLEQEVTDGRFRADLRFRLDVLRINVPALRDRIADIPLLAAHFWRDASARVGSRASLGPDAIAALSRYDWPGNVRELQNAIAWLAVHAPRRGRIGAGLLPSRLASSMPLSTGTFEAAREDFERRFVRAALAQTGGRRARAAEVLGLSRQGLAKMLRRLKIE
jgi:transcriptional regulator with AAA-type ATPase domain/tetratricopeptide (TPR) repeat protein